MFKKFASLALSVIVSFSLCACATVDTSESTDDKSKEYKKIIRDSATKLNTTFTDYIIANTLNAPDGDTEYLEVVHEDLSYSEYSIDSDNNLGTLQYGSADTISYVLTDWLNSDGKYYLFSSDKDDKSVIYSIPDNYNSFVKDRPFLYVNKLLDNAKSIEDFGDMELDLGNGVETVKTYKIKVKNEVLKEILGVSSYGIYKSIVDDKDTDANVKKLCGYYLEDLDMNLTFSDANVVVGVDNDGILKYMCLETGGLGTRLYLTKAIVATRNNNLREVPDFSEAVPYTTTFKELADYVATFDTYDDALDAISDFGGDFPEAVESEVELTEESTETVVETEAISETVVETEAVTETAVETEVIAETDTAEQTTEDATATETAE